MGRMSYLLLIVLTLLVLFEGYLVAIEIGQNVPQSIDGIDVVVNTQ